MKTFLQRWESLLSIPQSTALKGVLAICVLLCHVVPASKVFYGSVLSPLIGSLGYLAVSVFFFLSGYGITTQYEKKKQSYLQTFLKNRVLSIYLLNIFLIVLYGVFHLIVGNTLSVPHVLKSFLIGDTIVSNGWYLQTVMLFYLIWYVAFCPPPMNTGTPLRYTVLVAGILLYMLIAGILLSGSFWYECSLSFLLGVVFCTKKDRVKQLLFGSVRRYVLSILATFLLFVIFYIARHIHWINDPLLNTGIRTAFTCLSSPVFCIFVILTLPILSLEKSKLISYLGTISLEIYVLQGIPLNLFHSKFLYISNGWLYILCVTAATLALSVCLHPLLSWITNIPKKFLGNGKTNSI